MALSHIHLTWSPNMVNITGEPSLVPNPAHKLWLRQDRLILQAIQASVAGSVAPLISSCTTAAEAWCKLQTTLANCSRTRMLGLLSNLMKTKQEGSTIADYLQTIKVIIDDLALIGHSLSDEEVLIHTLNGLGGEYKELAVALRARDSPISFEELYDKLIDYETYLKRDDRLPGPPITAQVNQKSKRKSNQYNKHVNNGLAKLPPSPMAPRPNPPHPYQGGNFHNPQSSHPNFTSHQ